ncbi:hypothetical protein [Nocardioides sp.]|uniref:hypothetical protein n=1 Tax=Nocardioides sp. TaxID=35761 RepID=UPI0035197C20
MLRTSRPLSTPLTGPLTGPLAGPLTGLVAAAVLGSGAALGVVAPAGAAPDAPVAHVAPGAPVAQRGLLGSLLSAVQLPVLSGAGDVGSVLTLADPVWSLLGVTNSYQWLRDGVPIPGATGATYLPVAEDAGRQITGMVTGKLLGLLPVSVLSNVLPIAGGSGLPDPTSLLATVLPLLSGVPGVGQVLSLSATQWNLPGVVTSVQWLRDGVPILGATGSQYVPVAADAGRQITALVTGRLLGLLPTSVLSSAATIPGADVVDQVVATVAPLLSGVPVVGDVLTLVPGEFSVPGVTSSVQWLSNGLPIPGATGLSLPLTEALSGTDISALVTGTLAGIPVVSVLTGALGVGDLASSLTADGLPTLTGAGKVGSLLSAASPAWATSGVSTTFQWLRNSVPIPGATSATYRLTAADLAKQIAVKVIGTKAGATGAFSSAPVLVDLADALVASVAPAISGSARPGGLLSATTGTWSGAPDVFLYRWLRDGTVIPGATGAQYTPVAADAGRRISALVAAPLTGADLGYATSAAVTVARALSTLSLDAPARVPADVRPVVTLGLAAVGLDPAGVVRILDGDRVLDTVRLAAGDDGSRAVRLPRLAPGVHVLRAVFPGTRTTAPSTSAPVRVRVIR